MPGRTLEESNIIRDLVKAALTNGAKTPRAVLKYVKQNTTIHPPTLPTVVAIMKDMGYRPIKTVWEIQK